VKPRHAFITGFLAISLAACGSTGAAGAQASGSKLDASYKDALPPASQLVIGTLKMDGTSTAVDAAQAAKLLPLWQAYSSLLGSSTAAEEEFTGLEHQIEAAMTPAQLEAIAMLKLTTSETQSVFAPGGASMFAGGTPFPRTGTNGSGAGQSNRQGDGEGGFFVGGGGPPPGEAGGFTGGYPGAGGVPGQGRTGGTPSAQLRATFEAQSASQQQLAGVNERLVFVVVRYLERMLAPTPTPAP
jgi:hypothetical protein